MAGSKKKGNTQCVGEKGRELLCLTFLFFSLFSQPLLCTAFPCAGRLVPAAGA